MAEEPGPGEGAAAVNAIIALQREFSFEGQHPLRVVTRDNGSWFIAVDICRALGLSDKVVARTAAADEKGLHPVLTPGGTQRLTVVSESGLYKLIMRSDKPEARRFQDWVTRDVLPTIRRTGSYVAGEEKLADPSLSIADLDRLNDQIVSLLRRKGELLEAKVAALAADNAVLAPKAAGLDRLAARNGAENISDTAKALGKRPGFLFDWLHDHRWIFRRHDKAPWRGFQDKLDSGLLVHVERPDKRREDRTFTVCLVTPKGRARLAELIEREKAAVPGVRPS